MLHLVIAPTGRIYSIMQMWLGLAAEYLAPYMVATLFLGQSMGVGYDYARTIEGSFRL